MAWGTEAQKDRYLAKILSAEEIWCEGFSEPDAGSDLAAARTRIEDRGDHFLVNGQKVWSSFAHIADFCILVGLGLPDEPRYKNLTYVIADMHAPGVEVRPLVQITGHPEFNEIFFTDVRVPKENLLGEIGGGWQVAMTTLLHERGTLGFALAATLDVAVRKLLALAKERNVTDPILRDRIAREWVELQALRYTNYRALTTLEKTGIPGPGRIGVEARLVGEQPASDQARARDPRLARAAHRRWRLRRRVLAVPAAPLAREHDRGRHQRDPSQHRRRARARPSPGAADGPFLHRRAGRPPPRQALGLPRGEPVADPRPARVARLVGVLQSEDFGFLDAAVLFEELGRVLYDGPYVLSEVAGQPGEEVWSIEIDGFVPYLDQVDRVLTPDMHGCPALGEQVATVDETVGPGGRPRTAPVRRPARGSTCDAGCSPRSRSKRSGSGRRRSSR